MSEFQELYCHECNSYCRFRTKPEITGNVTVVCRNCGHQHFRYVVNGQVTDDRWKHGGGKAPLFIRASIARNDALSQQKRNTDDPDGFLRGAWARRFG